MNRLSASLLGLAAVGTVVLGASPAEAQIVELGDQIELDLRQNRNPELRPSLSTDGERLNLQLEEQPRPETRFRLGEDGVEIRQEQPEPRERLNLTVPLENEQ
ncbi:hypothetical protein PGN35_006580 [Nodosilinea sp. PGN35]|uniref:hypothetical protein n=1 Tax=Nodosilinea sp. PGN35 TaxID=3020489 RepID=UPI0023B27999|nr:hypothetical protein [Nodosilinea sp. TSF1-S3]MDF0366034.1 hypothetical protein [Nodosilinea sp. TSF1-S3]